MLAFIVGADDAEDARRDLEDEPLVDDGSFSHVGQGLLSNEADAMDRAAVYWEIGGGGQGSHVSVVWPYSEARAKRETTTTHRTIVRARERRIRT